MIREHATLGEQQVFGASPLPGGGGQRDKRLGGEGERQEERLRAGWWAAGRRWAGRFGERGDGAWR
ncbi:MAG: hypothetical protein ACUVX8_12555 [Candidatus Zipacnadales bacterium]